MEYIRQNKFTDCRNCPNIEKGTFNRMELPKGMIRPKARQTRNAVFFLIRGSVYINSNEHPNLIMKEGQFILQAIGSEVEGKILEDTECVLYEFDEPISICDERFKKMEKFEDPPLIQPPMEMCRPLKLFIEGLYLYLENDYICGKLATAKRKELAYLLNCYYPIKELSAFYYPIMAYSNTFKYFVKQNYLKAKNVEDLSSMAGYSVTSFRRMFRSTFGEPAYQWILKQKQTDILSDLESSSLSISEICYKFGFESLSHFSHFCKSNFGKSPRACRADLLKSAK